MIVSGTVKDRKSGQSLVGAKVFVSDFNGRVVNNIGTTTDVFGNYQLEIPIELIDDNYITASFFGYTPITQKLVRNFRIYTFDLSDEIQTYDAVTIIGTSPKTRCENKGGFYDEDAKICLIKNKDKKNGLLIAGVSLLSASIIGLIIYSIVKK